MIRKFFFVILLSINLLASGCNRIVKISIVLPPRLIPYYEWLIDFPRWQPAPEGPGPIEIWSEYGQVFSPIIQKTDTIRIALPSVLGDKNV